MDVIILLKLGQLFQKRAQESKKLAEQAMLEARVEALFKYSLYIIRMQSSHRSSADPIRRLFKYAVGGSQQDIDKEVNQLSEEAITFLGVRYIKNNEFEECIEELSGIKLPFATYFQAEACRKMTELVNTPKKNKRAYLEKAKEYLTQTLNLLEDPSVDKNHPLKSIVHSDIRRLQHDSRKVETNQSFNDSFVSASNNSRSEHYHDFEDSTPRHRRDAGSSVAPAPVIINNNENIEKLIREMMGSLTILKDDVSDMKERMADMGDRVQRIEELQKKSSHQQDLGSVDPLDDYYLLDDELQQSAASGYLNNTSMFTNVSRLNASHNPNNAFTPQQQQQYGIHQQAAAVAAAALNLNSSPALFRGKHGD